MARNGSGTMAIVNSFSANTTISSSEMNANFTDVASEITNSLPRDGQAAMTGVLKVSAGAVTAPGLAFSTDTDTGLYRSASDELAVAVGGVIGHKVVATGGTLYASGSAVGSWDSTGLKNSGGENYDAFPAGTVMIFFQASAPTGWTGSDAHNDYALRIVSQASGVGGTSGGTTAFSTVFTSRTITQANLPNVNLTAASNGAHTHDLSTKFTETAQGTAGSYGLLARDTEGSASGPETTVSSGAASNGAHTHTVPLGGSGTAMDFATAFVDCIKAAKD